MVTIQLFIDHSMDFKHLTKLMPIYILKASNRLFLIWRSQEEVIQGRIQDFKLGGRTLKKKLRRAEGGAKFFGVFRVKNHDFTPKKIIFFPILGGTRDGCAPPPWIRPCNQPFRSNAIAYLSSLLTDIQIFEKQSRRDTLTDINISHG